MVVKHNRPWTLSVLIGAQMIFRSACPEAGIWLPSQLIFDGVLRASAGESVDVSYPAHSVVVVLSHG